MMNASMIPPLDSFQNKTTVILVLVVMKTTSTETKAHTPKKFKDVIREQIVQQMEQEEDGGD